MEGTEPLRQNIAFWHVLLPLFLLGMPVPHRETVTGHAFLLPMSSSPFLPRVRGGEHPRKQNHKGTIKMEEATPKKKTSSMEMLKGWAFPLTIAAGAVMGLMMAGVPKITAPAVASIGLALATLAFLKGIAEKQILAIIISILLLAGFVITSIGVSNDMDRAARSMSF